MGLLAIMNIGEILVVVGYLIFMCFMISGAWKEVRTNDPTRLLKTMSYGILIGTAVSVTGAVIAVAA